MTSELEALVAEIVAAAEAKNRRAANDFFAALSEIAAGEAGDPRAAARRALHKRDFPT